MGGFIASFVISSDLLTDHAWLKEAVKTGLDNAAQAILDDARNAAPVDTGTLRDSGHISSPGDADYESGDELGRDIIFDAADDADHHYADYVEEGTVNTPAQPFLLPAVESMGAEGVSAHIESEFG